MKKRAISFLMALLLFVGSPMTVHASSVIQLVGKIGNDIINDLMLNGAQIGNLIRHYFETFGLWLSYDKWGDGLLFDHFDEYIQEKAIIQTSETYEDYLRAHLSVGEDDNGDPTLIADSDLMNTIYDFSQDLISDCGWYNFRTCDYRDVSSTYFKTKTIYDEYISYCENNLKGTDNTCYLGSSFGYDVEVDSGKEYMQILTITKPLSNVEYYLCRLFEEYDCCHGYITQDWNTLTLCYDILAENGSLRDSNLTMGSISCLYSNNYNFQESIPLTDGSRIVRVYKSLEDLKMYSVGQRPYYMTTEYNNYNSMVDNSTTITQTTIDNSITYGDVYNYITNNYENPDSLTEDELRDILDDYLEELNNNKNNDSGGGSGGSDSGSDDSGGGLGGFLSGLGSIGDAILAILGKLMDIIGQAIELVTVGFGDIVTVIPESVGNLLVAVFPFFPEEWVSAITLSLLLGIIVGIIRMFK